MSPAHFSREMNRLMDVFGVNAYPKERAKIIWGEVRDLSDFWLTRTVDYFIGYHRQAPLMTEFKEQINLEKNRLRQEEQRIRIFQPDDNNVTYISDPERVRKLIGKIYSPMPETKEDGSET